MCLTGPCQSCECGWFSLPGDPKVKHCPDCGRFPADAYRRGFMERNFGPNPSRTHAVSIAPERLRPPRD